MLHIEFRIDDFHTKQQFRLQIADWNEFYSDSF